jgi:hypothetical protein
MMRIRRAIQLALLSVAALSALSLTACSDKNAANTGVASGGGTPASSASASGGNAQMNGQDAQLKFAQCMRENGVNIPDPQPGQPLRMTDPNASQAKMEAATKKCQPLLQAGGGGPINPNDPAVQDAMVKFTQCMRAHGVNIPDPGPGGQMQIPNGVAQDKLQQAQQACQQYLPGGGGR